MSNPDAVYDVVILGGGPSGCATALSLVREGIKRILVVESSGYETGRAAETIPPDSRGILSELDLLHAFYAQGHEPCFGRCSVWGSSQVRYDHFMFNPCGHGWHLDRRRFDRFLAEQVDERGIELWRGARFCQARSVGEKNELLIQRREMGEQRIQARFVVDATGSPGHFVRGTKLRRLELDELLTISAAFRAPPESSFSRLNVIEAAEYGWWSTSKLPGDRVLASLTTSPTLARHLDLTRAARWISALSSTLSLTDLLTEGELLPGNLELRNSCSFVLERCVGENWLAVGDAAASHDPISSRGIFKALGEGLSAGRFIARHLRGDLFALADYNQEIDESFAAYEERRYELYRLETRWSHAPFWVGRRTRSSDPHRAPIPLNSGLVDRSSTPLPL